MLCIDEKKEYVIVKGILRKVSVRQLSALQMKILVRKWYEVFGVHVVNYTNQDFSNLCNGNFQFSTMLGDT